MVWLTAKNCLSSNLHKNGH